MPMPIPDWLPPAHNLEEVIANYKPLPNCQCYLTDESKDGITYVAVVRGGRWEKAILHIPTPEEKNADALCRIATALESIVELLQDTNHQLNALR